MVKFRSDNGGEYISYAFEEYLVEAKIKHETSKFYYLQQNNKMRQHDYHKKFQEYVAFSKT